MPEEELKNMARMIDLNRQRLEQLQDQVSRLEIVQVEAGDVETSLLAMSRLSNAAESAQSDKKENKVMIPIGSGVHLPTTVEANTTAVIDIGSGIFAEKNPDDAAKIIRTRITDLGIIITELNIEAETITEKINAMSAEFNLAAQKMTGSGVAEGGSSIPPFSEDNGTESITEGGKDTTSEQKNQPKTSRRRGFGGELTLDD
jgi:prefoldin alpha subunit